MNTRTKIVIGLVTLVAALFPLSSATVEHRAIFNRTSPVDGERFGDAVDISSTQSGISLIVAGGQDDCGVAQNCGRAAIFSTELASDGNVTWTYVAELMPSDSLVANAFGAAVSISPDGTQAVVGAINDNSATWTGSAYYYEKDQGGADSWGEVKRFDAGGDANSNDEFGHAVAVEGDWIFVGSPYDSIAATSNGAVFAYNRDQGGAGMWGLNQKIYNSDVNTNGLFGHDLDYQDDILVVGAPNRGPTGTCYVFERPASTWVESALLLPSDGVAGDDFGWSVATAGQQYVICGSKGQDQIASNAGAVYIFHRDEGGADNWGEVAKVQADGLDENYWFGQDLAMTNTSFIVGAYGLDEFSANSAGGGYVFDLETQEQRGLVVATNPDGGDHCGWNVALNDDTVVIGCPQYEPEPANTPNDAGGVIVRHGLPACGDGLLEPLSSVETCDDGNTVTEACAYGLTSCTVCNATCISASGIASYCGDGLIDSGAGEECDDGGLVVGDGCGVTCQIEVCGDGIINNFDNETCDDGNLVSGDGCDDECQTECPVGMVTTGSIADCQPCPISTYAENSLELCKACPPRSVTLEDGSVLADCICDTGTYGDPTLETGCINCPDGALCDEQGMSSPVVAPGYWQDPDSTDFIFMQCPVASACPGGEAASSCAEGYEGFLCGSCSSQYYADGTLCKPCTGNSTLTLVGTAVGLVIFTIFKVRVGGHISTLGKALAPMAIVVNFAQVMAVVGSYQVPWPDALRQLFASFDVLNFDIQAAAPECSVPLDYHSKLILKLVSPLVVAAICLVVGVVSSLFLCLCGKKSDEEDGKEDGDEEGDGSKGAKPKKSTRAGPGSKAVGAWIAIMVMMYTQLASTSLDPLRCTRHANGSITLVSDPTVVCGSSEWSSSLMWALGGIGAWVIGFPLLLIVGFRYGARRKSAYTDSKDATAWTTIFGAVSTHKYVRSWFWFELILMAKKLVVIGTTMLPTAFQQTLAGFLSLFAFVILQSWAHPFGQGLLNSVELAATVATVISLFSAILFAGGSIPDDGSEQVIVTVVYISVVLTAFAAAYGVLDGLGYTNRSKAAKVMPFVGPADLTERLAPWFGGSPSRIRKGVSALLEGPRVNLESLLTALMAAEDELARVTTGMEELNISGLLKNEVVGRQMILIGAVQSLPTAPERSAALATMDELYKISHMGLRSASVAKLSQQGSFTRMGSFKNDPSASRPSSPMGTPGLSSPTPATRKGNAARRPRRRT